MTKGSAIARCFDLSLRPFVAFSHQGQAWPPAPGRVLFHMGFTCENGVIGNVVMGTVQSRGTPMEQITVMGDHNRVEIANVINVAWHRDPPFKAEDPAATLSSASGYPDLDPQFHRRRQ